MATEKLKTVCSNCRGACCRSEINLALSKKEVAFLESGGAVLKTRATNELARRLATDSGATAIEAREFLEIYPDGGMHELVGNCPYLQIDSTNGRGRCSVYNNPLKPRICSAFQEGGSGCQKLFTPIDQNDIRPGSVESVGEIYAGDLLKAI